MKIKFTKYQFKDSMGSMMGQPEQIDKPATELTAREYALIKYRCAALTGFLASIQPVEVEPKILQDFYNATPGGADGVAQAMLKLDEEVGE